MKFNKTLFLRSLRADKHDLVNRWLGIYKTSGYFTDGVTLYTQPLATHLVDYVCTRYKISLEEVEERQIPSSYFASIFSKDGKTLAQVLPHEKPELRYVHSSEADNTIHAQIASFLQNTYQTGNWFSGRRNSPVLIRDSTDTRVLAVTMPIFTNPF